MAAKNLTDDDVLRKLNASDNVSPDDVPAPLMQVARYIVENTGLAGDYNDGVVKFTEGGHVIQWYPRSRLFSSHDNLLTWVQTEADGAILGQVGTRRHPETGEKTGYIEIHDKDRWVTE